jgi:hypothetical protein
LHKSAKFREKSDFCKGDHSFLWFRRQKTAVDTTAFVRFDGKEMPTSFGGFAGEKPAASKVLHRCGMFLNFSLNYDISLVEMKVA